MHEYLRSIGFREVKKKAQFRELLDTVIKNPDRKVIISLDEESNMTFLSKEVAEGMGLALCGETEEDGSFRMEYHFPYMIRKESSTEAECTIRRQSERMCYNGVVDDYRVGMTLIFYLNNFVEYCKGYSNQGKFPKVNGVALSGLVMSGKILMPILHSKRELELAKKEKTKRNEMIRAAREGDADAIEDLTIEDMNLYTKVSEKAMKVDMYSLIESFLIPEGLECDQYTIMGDILSVEYQKNALSGENLIVMELECNDIPIRVVVNEADLLGVPMIGRRFKGNVWLQGNALFTS